MSEGPKLERSAQAIEWGERIAVVLGLALAAGLVWFAATGAPDATGPAPAPAVSAPLRVPAPELTYDDLQGETRRLSHLRGEPVLLHFWATWCGPCVDELPALLDAAERRDLPLLAISLDDDEEAIRRFFDGDVPEAIAWAPEGRVNAAFGLTSLPQTLAIDTEGRLRLRILGPRDWSDPEVLAEVRAALRGHPHE